MEHRIGDHGADMSVPFGRTIGPGERELVDAAIVSEIARAIGREALAGLVHRHLDGVARALELVESWRGSGQWADVKREAHRMKGSAATLGFVRLSELWVEMEGHAAMASGADVKRLVTRIQMVHGELRGWASSRFAARIGAA